jgi:predicted O-linked N-acetylglucosamine transferase (SPINDLY family)
MTTVAIQEAFKVAVGHHKAGRLAEAESVYRQILQDAPDNPDALHLLGMLLHRMGRSGDGLQMIGRAIQIKPDSAEYYGNLGLVLAARGHSKEAITAYRRALALKEDYPEAHGNLGLALMEKGETDQAIEAYRRSLALRPKHAQTYNNLSNALQKKGNWQEAVEAARQALALKSDYAEAFNNLGVGLFDGGKLDDAIAAFRQAIDQRPSFAEALFNLGNACTRMEEWDEAIANFRQSLTISPENSLAHLKLGEAFMERGRLEEAIHFYKQAMALKPDFAEAFVLYAGALRERGEIDQSMDYFRRGIELNPDLYFAYAGLLYASHAHPDYDSAAILREHLRWSDHFARPLKQFIKPHQNDPSPERRLRVGYVSADFKEHVAGRNFLPLLQAHDHSAFEIFCYSNVGKPDGLTQQIRFLCDRWQNIAGLDDEQLAEMVRKDQIDILVDLSLHSGGNRLLAFARKPAPVQVSYLGYCSTTGLDTIDYRISDPYMDGPDADLSCYSEQTCRLPRSYWCYNPGEAVLPVSALPAIKAGHVTFGCLNTFTKVTTAALDLWAQVLAAVPGSHLLIHTKPGHHLEKLKKRFEEQGVSSDRIEFVKRLSLSHYMEVYNWVDVSLDPFPHTGGITSCDSLWMGVPVVTLTGRTAVGRAGVSVLSNVGLPELIAATPEQYVSIAVDLARDLTKLAEMRAGLRRQMQASPLMDAPGFARDMETAYRSMWRTWVANRSKGV